jgi:hypothetical protein
MLERRRKAFPTFGAACKDDTAEALAVSAPPDTWTLEEVPQRFARTVTRTLDRLSAEVDRLTQKRSTLLPFETALASQFDMKIANLRDEVTATENGLDRRFRRLDMIFLRMTKLQDKEKLPRFGVFDVDRPQPTCFVGVFGQFVDHVSHWRVYQRTWMEGSDATMVSFADCSALEKVVEAEVRSGYGTRQRTIFATFEGALPDDVRALIHETRGLFDQVFLVAEVEHWALGSSGKGDPLVVGRKGNLHWLITKFDTTPMEEYVSKEFTTSNWKDSL